MERDRAHRRFQRERVIANRLRTIKLTDNSSYDDSSYYNFKQQNGGLAKRKPYDCGRARCGMCHFEKIHGFRRTKYQAFSIQEELYLHGMWLEEDGLWGYEDPWEDCYTEADDYDWWKDWYYAWLACGSMSDQEKLYWVKKDTYDDFFYIAEMIREDPAFVKKYEVFL